MEYIIENNFIKATIFSHGAELKDLFNKTHNTNVIWQGDENVWSYSSPILFPIVGSLENNTFNWEGSNYSMNRHGFARLSEFSLVEHSSTKITLVLNSNEDTLKLYPFKFKFLVSYELVDNKLIIGFEVINTDENKIYFQLGAHPAFNVPFTSNSNVADYVLEFNEKETAGIHPNTSDGLILKDSVPYFNNESNIYLKNEDFKDDALIFKNLKSREVSITNVSEPYSIRVKFNDFPHLGIWSINETIPFICIEPWFGHSDESDNLTTFDQKSGITMLAPDELKHAEYSIEIVTK